jgi:tRNA(adenine34) deaminase
MDIILEAMKTAISEAKISLLDGNHGFGAVIFMGEAIVAHARDREETERDPTSHAEMNAIRLAAGALGKDLAGCAIVSTHEPCPMCASAITWSGIGEVIYGFSIQEAIEQGRDRLNISCREIFERSGRKISVRSGVLADECALLYDRNVRKEIKRIRNATEESLLEHDRESTERRVQWLEDEGVARSFMSSDPLDAAYRLLLRRLGISAEEAPIVERNRKRVVFHSKNPCPTLEACRILGLDTRFVCKRYNEGATDALVKWIDPRLRFVRNYEKLRPYSEYCEEMILLDEIPGTSEAAD